jgi:hypothetical protein
MSLKLCVETPVPYVYWQDHFVLEQNDISQHALKEIKPPLTWKV